ncbi:MAG: hypothetical protein ACE5EF_08770 [Dehalococcoidia bacterium]
MASEPVRAAYREAWEAWLAQLERLHAVLLDGENVGPAQLKGLLGREARAKEAYERARDGLLGIGPRSVDPDDSAANPFRRD